ncbi:unnamed protein product [Dibothriocephalus latus]|uniref:Uncharacterized protein n=1 Tax=Dibothriocephalus latus TaxID=60516 RepID=A0A3P7L1R8_DIBLA|nr:unnamed protein product [Dibothriocephalus latus]
MASLGITPTAFTSREAVHVLPSQQQQTIVHVPAGYEDVQLLSDYLTLIYPIDVEVSSDARQVTIRGAQPDELCNAQNFALRFLGPESVMVLKMPFGIQVLCTIKTIRRYFAVRCRVIVTVRGNKALILRDYDQLQAVSPALKSGLFDLLVEMEASVSTTAAAAAVTATASQGFPDTGLPTADESEEPAFVEAFRKPRGQDPAAVFRGKKTKLVNCLCTNGLKSTSTQVRTVLPFGF